MEERESARTPQKCLIINGSFAERDLQLVPHFEVQDGRESRASAHAREREREKEGRNTTTFATAASLQRHPRDGTERMHERDRETEGKKGRLRAKYCVFPASLQWCPRQSTEKRREKEKKKTREKQRAFVRERKSRKENESEGILLSRRYRVAKMHRMP